MAKYAIGQRAAHRVQAERKGDPQLQAERSARPPQWISTIGTSVESEEPRNVEPTPPHHRYAQIVVN